MTQRKIFVFGSNLAGIHGAGSALEARMKWGAKQGEGIGYHGNSFAIPTKDLNLNVLKLEYIKIYVNGFMKFAWAHPELQFHVVKIGCGLAGFKEEQIAPLFADAPGNVVLPEGW